MQFLLQYPEFFLAGLLSATWVFRTENPVQRALLEAARNIVYLMPERYLAWLQRMQNWAGWRDARTFHLICAAKVYPALLIGLIAFAVHPALAIVLAPAAYFLPDLVVLIAKQRRQGDILTTFPQALDLMVLCIDAGLGLDAALHRVASEQSLLAGALTEELTLLNRDILLGMDRDRAYEDLFVRSGVEELRTFGSALNQSSKLGLSIANVVRAQSDFVRLRQQQRAEERASKVSIWMVFPLWFCIMPALMCVLLAPSLLLFAKTIAHFPPEWFM